MPRLIVEKGPDRGKEIPIPSGTSLVIGRETTEGFKLRDSWASRAHFRVEARNGEYFLVDLKSLNGTFLNGKRVVQARLKTGDAIQVGETLFSFVADDVADPLLGQKVAGYRILERVGRGGMGTVYRAEQVDLKRIVAVKVISPEYSRNREFIERFIKEARAAAGLNHPNLVQVYDAKRHQDVYFFSMEFMAGGSVQAILGASRRLEPPRTVKMGIDAARGLHYAHQKGIVHRDVKPDNLMISDTQLVKVGDMGLAAPPEEQLQGEEEKYVLGTPHYIAPEQLLGKPASFRSDIYSLGSTLYRILAGRPPFAGASVPEIVQKKVREDPPKLAELKADIPRRLEEIVRRMMDRDPEKRFGTMQEVADALEEFDRRTTRVVAPGAIWGQPRRKLAFAAVGVALLVVAGLVGAWAIWPGPKPPNGNGNHTGDPEKDAEILYLRAEGFARELDPDDPEQVQQAAAMYREIVTRYGRTSWGPKALEAAERWEATISRVALAAAFAEAEARDRETYAAWRDAYEAAGDVPPLDPVRAAAAAYRAIAEGDPQGETGPAAARRAGVIAAWADRIEAVEALFSRLSSEARSAAEARRWGEAAGKVRELVEKAGAPDALESFDTERYATLLGAARLRRARAVESEIMTRLDGEIRRTGDRVMELAEAGEFSSARDEVAGARARFAETSGEAVVERWETEVRRRHAAWARERERAAREEADRLRREEAERFDGLALEVYVLEREFRFGEAFARIEGAFEQFQSTQFKLRLSARQREVEWATAYLERFARVLSDPEALRVDRRWGSSQIVRATLTGIEISDEQVCRPVPFAGMDEEEFARLMRRVPSRSPQEEMGLGWLFCDLGLFDEAAATWEGLTRLPQRDMAEAARQALERLRTAGLTDSPEVVATKHLAQLRALVESGRLDRAAREAALLRGRYEATRTFTGAREEIERLEGSIRARQGALLREEQRMERGRQLEEIRTAEETRIARLRDECLLAAQRLADAREGTRLLGELYLAHGDAGAAASAFAAYVAEGAEPDGELVDAYEMLVEALALSEEGARADSRLVEADERFRGTPSEAAWAERKAAIQEWRASLPQVREEVRALEAQLSENPFDARAVWELGRAYADGLLDRRKAHALFCALEGLTWDLEDIDPGDVVHGSAESSFRLFDLRQALRKFEEMKRDYPAHPRVRDAGRDGVDARVEQIVERAWRLGLNLEVLPYE